MNKEKRRAAALKVAKVLGQVEDAMVSKGGFAINFIVGIIPFLFLKACAWLMDKAYPRPRPTSFPAKWSVIEAENRLEADSGIALPGGEAWRKFSKMREQELYEGENARRIGRSILNTAIGN
ncbi:MAG TPA: hypothetical protein VHQ41_00345 [Patescibacteria group bacterium]|jgi:hypothetical protein|nr:hypothetical protein [Patescibacteria group bacterium]